MMKHESLLASEKVSENTTVSSEKMNGQHRMMGSKLPPKLTSMLMTKQPFKQSNASNQHSHHHHPTSDQTIGHRHQDENDSGGSTKPSSAVSNVSTVNTATSSLDEKPIENALPLNGKPTPNSSNMNSPITAQVNQTETSVKESPENPSFPTKSPPSPVMHVVILGGSFSGLSVAVTLAKNPPKDRTRITLIEPKSYLEVRWATIRSMFDSSVCDASTVPLSKILSEHSATITHVRAVARSVALDTITLDDGRQLPYDVLLVSTGAVTNFSPLTPHLTPGTDLPYGEALVQRRKFLKETGDSILDASSILVIGGGPVGTEIAADMASYAMKRGRELKVTLVDANDKLMPGYPRSIAQKLREKLSVLNVRVILGHHAVPHIVDDEVQYWKLKETGKKLDADFAVTATGVKPCTTNLFGDNSESTRDGWVKTDRFGRVIGWRGDVFAAGDCCDWSAKSGENTLANRNVYAHNIRLTVEAIANNRALASIDSRLKRVSVSHRPPAVVASSPRDGETVSPFAALSPSWWWMKNRGMLLAKAQKEIGW